MAAIGWALALCAGWDCASASPKSIAEGRRLAQVYCSSCHAIAGSAPSPTAEAPRFAELERLSAGRSLEETLAEVTLTRHPPMPSFVGNDEEMAALIDYIRSVQARPPN